MASKAFLERLLNPAIDYYTILEVSKDASKQLIKQNYRRLALVVHPDRNQDNKELATSAFQRLANAFETLSDDEKRNRYDESIRVNEPNCQQDQTYTNQEDNAMDIFQAMIIFLREMKQAIHNDEEIDMTTFAMCFVLAASDIIQYICSQYPLIAVIVAIVCGTVYLNDPHALGTFIRTFQWENLSKSTRLQIVEYLLSYYEYKANTSL